MLEIWPNNAKVVNFALLCSLGFPIAGCSMNTARNPDTIGRMATEYYLRNPSEFQKLLNVLADHQVETAKARDRNLAIDNRELILSHGAAIGYGIDTAPQTAVVFSDYNCTFCKRMHSFFRDHPYVKEGRLKVLVHELPILGSDSVKLARYAIAAREQGIYKQYHDAIMSYNGSAADKVRYSTEKFPALISIVERPTSANTIDVTLEQSRTVGNKLSVTATPTVIINDNIMRGWKEDAVIQSLSQGTN